MRGVACRWWSAPEGAAGEEGTVLCLLWTRLLCLLVVTYHDSVDARLQSHDQVLAWLSDQLTT